MKPIFGRGPSLQLRLFLAVVASVSLILLDSKLNLLSPYRVFLNSLVSPLQYVANAPSQLLDTVAEKVVSREQLQAQNKELEQQIFLVRSDLLLMDNLKEENNRLRKLLGSPLRGDARKMVAEIMEVDSDPFTHQVVIDKGSLNGVFEGQPVVNDQGVVGQVLRVGSTTSRILLITDISHGIPVRVQRNDMRTLANGTGELDKLDIPFIPHSTDIQEGDVLVTSGLGGRFPEGYPVATIEKFEYDQGMPYARVQASPVVALDRIRYLLLLWPDDKSKQGLNPVPLNDSESESDPEQEAPTTESPSEAEASNEASSNEQTEAETATSEATNG